MVSAAGLGETDRRQQLRHLGEVLAVTLAAYLFAGVIVSALSPTTSGLNLIAVTENEPRLARTVLQYSSLAAVVVWYATVIDTDQLIGWAVPDSRGVGLIVAGSVGLVATNLVLNWMLSVVGFEAGENVAITAGVGDPTYFLAMVVLSVLFVGPAEELLFRGVVQGRLRESWGVWPAIIGATLLFGVIHIPAVSGGVGGVVSYIVTVVVLGLLLGWLYERTQNIVVPSVIHGLNNAVIFGWFYLQEVSAV